MDVLVGDSIWLMLRNSRMEHQFGGVVRVYGMVLVAEEGPNKEGILYTPGN